MKRNALNTLLTLSIAGMLVTGTAVAGPTDVSGEYWYGWLGANAATGAPGSDSGAMSAASDAWTIEYVHDGGGPFTETLQIDDMRIVRGGWLEVDATQDGESGTMTMASTGSILVDATRTPDADGDHGIGLYHQKAIGLASSDVIGHYACLDHWLDVPSRSTSVGFMTVAVASDGSWTASRAGTVEETGSWSLDSPNAVVSLSFDGEAETADLGVGPGGLLTFFDTDPVEDDDLGHSILLKKGTGRIVSEALGEYLIQGFYTDEDGTDPLTEWGKVILQENNCWSLAGQDSDGNSYAKTGSWTLADDGFLQLTDVATGSLLYEGYLSLDGELIVAARVDDRIGTALMVQVPEPASLALLTLGGLIAMYRSRNTSNIQCEGDIMPKNTIWFQILIMGVCLFPSAVPANAASFGVQWTTHNPSNPGTYTKFYFETEPRDDVATVTLNGTPMVWDDEDEAEIFYYGTYASGSFDLVLQDSGGGQSGYSFELAAVQPDDVPEFATILTPSEGESVVGTYTTTWSHNTGPGEVVEAYFEKDGFYQELHGEDTSWEDYSWTLDNIPGGDGAFEVKYERDVTSTHLLNWQHVSGTDSIGANILAETASSVSVAFVPEPATLGLLAFGGSAVLRRRHR